MEETVNLSQSGMIMAKNSMSIVEGFSFDDEDLLKEAKKEAEGVRYMKARVDLQYPDRVLQIYQRMVAQNMFQTQVGYAYLRELQDYLYTMPQVSNDEVPPLPVHTPVNRGVTRRKPKEQACFPLVGGHQLLCGRCDRHHVCDRYEQQQPDGTQL